MNTLLADLFSKAEKLPEDAQELLASELMLELEWEDKWTSKLNNDAPETVDKLFDQANKDYHEGKCTEGGFNIS